MNISIIPVNNIETDIGFIIQPEMITFGKVTQIQVDGQIYLVAGTAQEQITRENIRFLGGDVRKEIQKYAACTTATISFEQLHQHCSGFSEEEVVTAFIEGWYLGGYKFSTYKKEEQTEAVTLKVDEKYQAYAATAFVTANAVNVARDLCNEPANQLTPAIYADRLKALFADTNVEVDIIETADLEERGFPATAIVGGGSKYPAKVAICTLKNSDTKKHMSLVGKGITFDSGGTNVKTGSDIGEMKMDMGGSAAVVGTMKLLADANSPVHVTAILPLATNVAGKDAFLPSDVITYHNGMTVEVGNTDAEGRLVLADGIVYAQEIGAETIIDIATLTGTIGQALGLKTAGIFSNHEADLWSYKELGEQTGDHVWPMPVTRDYQTYIDSNTADINNMSTSPFGGAITAALFLENFVEKGKKWIHIDMANTVRPWKEQGYHVTGAAGFGVRLLTEIILNEK